MTFDELPIGAYFTFADMNPTSEGRISMLRKVSLSNTLLKDEYINQTNYEHILNVQDGTVVSIDADQLKTKVYHIVG